VSEVLGTSTDAVACVGESGSKVEADSRDRGEADVGAGWVSAAGVALAPAPATVATASRRTINSADIRM
jgi:hypothetical protein